MVYTASDPARERPRSHVATEMRGLLHDLGQGLATLSLITDGIRDDPGLPTDTRGRLDVAEKELTRLLELVRRSLHEPVPEAVEVRALAGQLVSLTGLSCPTSVTLLAGEPLVLRTDRTMLWRMLVNLVDNAVRAAGPNGTVEVSVAGGSEPVIEVTDDGPGFGHGPEGVASLGLGIVTGLVHRCGGRLRVQPADSGGTRASLVFSTGGQAA